MNDIILSDVNFPQKRCSKCRKLKPATTEYFSVDNRTSDKLYVQCKECKRGTSRKSRAKIKSELPPRQRKNPTFLVAPEGFKKCCHCDKIKPATHTFFHRSKSTEDGFDHRCKECRTVKRDTLRSRGLKQCTYCKEVKPATHEHFSKKLQYMTPICKVCNAKISALPENKAANTISRRKRYRANPVKMNAITQKRRARKKEVGGTYTPEDIQRKFKAQKGRCYYCHKKMDKFQIDHVVPLSREGSSNGPDNIVLACPSCNIRKNNKLPHEWPEGGRLL